MIAKTDQLLPQIQNYADRAIRAANELLDLELFITESYRTPERQNELYAQGRTTPGKIVTYLKSTQSMHVQRRAFDLVDKQKGYNLDWAAIGKIIKSYGWFHGRDFGDGFVDNPHFEWRGNMPANEKPTEERTNMYEVGCKVECIQETMLRETPSDIGVGVPTRGGLGNIFAHGWTAIIQERTGDFHWYNLGLGGQSGWVKFDTIKAVPNDVPKVDITELNLVKDRLFQVKKQLTDIAGGL